MDVNTGHLVADIDMVAELDRHKYTKVPKHLHPEAERALAGQHEVTVNPNTAANLAAWATNQRKKSRTRAKLAKKSRKANRK